MPLIAIMARESPAPDTPPPTLHPRSFVLYKLTQHSRVPPLPETPPLQRHRFLNGSFSSIGFSMGLKDILAISAARNAAAEHQEGRMRNEKLSNVMAIGEGGEKEMVGDVMGVTHKIEPEGSRYKNFDERLTICFNFLESTVGALQCH